MITYKEFEKYMKVVIAYTERDDKLSDILKTEGFVTYSSEAINALIELIEIALEDEEHWVEYWCWECDFGKIDLEVYDEDENIVPFTTLEDVYYWVTVGSKL